MVNEIIAGLQFNWSLIKKLGEGDAGEVYLVESLAGERSGVLKRPQKSAFTGEILRQARQIRTEGMVLKSLPPFRVPGTGVEMRVPELLDQSKAGTDLTERFFIVVEKAAGFDLSFLARSSRMGFIDQDEIFTQLSAEEEVFLKSIAANGRIPDRILLNCLASLLEILHHIHQTGIEAYGGRVEGLIYNDIKLEHIFWDARKLSITLIDWGNAQFLEGGGMSRDRQYSTRDDYSQYVDEIGKYLVSSAPDLHSRLKWPAQFDTEEDLFQPGGLSERINATLLQEVNHLSQINSHQEDLFKLGNASEEVLDQIELVHKELLALGEMPDYRGAARFASGFASQLVIDGNASMLQRLSDWVARLPLEQNGQWGLIASLAQIALRSQGNFRKYLLDALQAALCSDYKSVLWLLVEGIQDTPAPNWWFELIGQVRNLELGPEADTLLPLVAVNRLVLCLHALIRKSEDQQARLLSQNQNVPAQDLDELNRLKHIVRSLLEDVVSTWTMADPPPPNAFLDYDNLSRTIKELGTILLTEQQLVERQLYRPRVQVRIVLDAWERKEFVTANQGLRHILLWDPDRRRVLRADQLILSAPDWLKRVHLGPPEGENFVEFATDLEFEGREVRNHVGPAVWLDEILTCFSQLRKGVWPTDLITSLPGLIHELPWLKKFERVERLPAEVKQLTGELAPVRSAGVFDITGTREGRLGTAGELRLLEPLDAWPPEARGSSARVYLGEQVGEKGLSRQVAVKLMRIDKADYSIPLFREEVLILPLMGPVPGVSRMFECGFLLPEEAGSLPPDADLQAIQDLKGSLVRIGPESGQVFLDQIERRVKEGWTPYLTVEKREKEDSLLLLCDTGLTNGKFLPLITLLQMAIQICDILQAAHDRNIVYRDHKILHYYWHEKTNGVYLIDWNVARLHPGGLSEYERQMDLVQFGARGLHHILTGRSAPGALPLGPTQPEEIEHAAQSYRTQWTYDDQRLSQGLRDIIEAVLAGKYTQAGKLGEDLKETYMAQPYASAADKAF
jgi:serine/threonine protein kinase